MKKIIYSLVIMIAAGSLFTSCIEPVEPNGLEQLRLAKADYLKALATLQQSKTQLVAAQAAAEQALAAQRTAEATYQTALANYQDALTAALRAQTEMDQQRFNIEMQNLTKLYEHEALMRALEYDAAVAALDAMKDKYAAEAAEAAVQLALLQAEVNYKELLNEAQRIQNMKDQQDMELAKKAFEQEYGQQAAMFALELARYEAETAQMAAEAAALVAAQELLNKNQELQNSKLAQDIEQAKKEFEQKYGYQEALNALELARIQAANDAAAKEAEAKLEDLIDQIGYNAAMRALAIARQAVQDENDAAAMEIALKELEQAYNKQVALDAIEIAEAQVALAKKQLDLEGFAAQIEDLKKNFEYAEIYRAYELQKAIDNYGIDALKAANEIENLKMQQELNQVLFAQAIANAKQSLKETLDAIDLKNVGLTEAEKTKIADVIAAYELAYRNYLDQQYRVMMAESALFDAEYAATHPAEDYYVFLTEQDSKQHAGLYTVNFAPTVENYEAAIALLRQFIEQDKQAIAELEEKGDKPNDADLKAWAEELQAWKDQMAQNEYDLYKLTQDSINYMVNVYHDGIAAVKEAVDDFEREHQEPFVGPNPGPEPVKGEEGYTIDDLVPAEELEFPILELAEGDTHAIDKFSDYSFKKLFHMLDGYPGHYSDYFREGLIKHNPMKGELSLDDVDRTMRDFILGAAELTANDKLEYEDEYEGYFGLEGVYAALSREKVMKEKDETWKETAEKNYKKYKEAWEKDYDTLSKGFKAYPKYTKALNDWYTALQELSDAVNAEKTKGNKMVQAVLDFQEQLNIIAGHEQMTLNDSTKIFEAIQNFAAARKDYLGPMVKAQGTKTAAQIRAAVENFHYAAASAPVTAADIDWADMTWNDLRTNQNRGTEYGNASIYAFNASNGKAYVGQSGEEYATNAIFAVLVDQLINKDIANKFDNEPVIQWANPIGTGMQGINAQECQALYGQFKMVKDGDPVDGVQKYKFQTYPGGEDVKSPEIVAAEKKFANATAALDNARLGWIRLHNRFWNENVDEETGKSELSAYMLAIAVAVDGGKTVEQAKAVPANKTKLENFEKAVINATTKKLDPNCYVLETFTDPTTCVYFFDDYDEIANAEDLNVVLTAVDPRAEGDREGVYGDFRAGNYNQAQILFGRGSWSNPTEFTLYLYWKQMYEASNVDLAGDLELLRAWIDGIIEVFDAAQEAAEEAFDEAFEEAYAEWEEAVAEYEAAVAAHEQWDADMTEFWGTYEEPDGTIDTLYHYYWAGMHMGLMPVDGWRALFAPVNYTNYFIDHVNGTWNWEEKPGMHRHLIAGTFKELLEENLPEYPEKIAEWFAAKAQYMDEQYHLNTLYEVMNDAYMAAAAVLDPTIPEDNIIDYVAGYQRRIQRAIAALYDEINEHTAMIEEFNYAIAQIEAGVDPYTVWATVCQMNLDYQNQVLDDLKVKFDLAKKDYDDVMDYINAKSEE